MRSVGALLLGAAIATAPALTWAQHAGGGGGGHASGGGGGGHFGGGAHFGGGLGGGHYGGGMHSFAAPHYGVSGHYYGGRYFAPSGHGFAYAGAHYAARPGYVARGAAVAPHPPGYHPPGAPGAYYHPWVGGYWHGTYWPHAWYYPGWAWYLPILPVGYATFWWGGVPYYYWNSLYYTYSPADNGYVVTDPPPAAGTEGSADAGGAYEQAPQSNYPPNGGAGTASDIYMYPRNGQSQEQMQNDRYECHGWAVNQSGFDPTRQDNSGNPADYRRVMVACLDARGYSAR